jgi:hypothetical protein
LQVVFLSYMTKLLLTVLIACYLTNATAQQDFFVLRKGDKTIRHFHKGSYLSFQLKSKEWNKGFITKIENDSFYFTKEVVIYHLASRADTFHFGGFHYALTDIYALPKRGVQIDHINGHFQITGSGGHQHFYWIKSGWIFRAGGAGYTALNIINGAIKNNYSLTGGKIGIAAGVFATGVILKKAYKLTRRMGRRYHLPTIKVYAPSPA